LARRRAAEGIPVIALSLLPLLVGSALPGPLVHALTVARAHSHALGVSRAQLAGQEAQVDAAFATLLPSLQANGAYTRNEYLAELNLSSVPPGLFPPGTPTKIVVSPYNQWGANLGVNVPLIEPGGIAHYSSARHSRDAAVGALRASDDEILLGTARAYYDVVAAQGVVEAAVRALTTAKDNLQVTQVRKTAGAANQLAVDRANVDVARGEQTLATAEQTLGVARRNLETLTGEPQTADLPMLTEPDLPSRSENDYVDSAERLRPEVVQAQETLLQLEGTLDEAWLQLAPSLVGSAQEHFTNATGFTGKEAYWTAGATLNWNIDPSGTRAAVRHAQAAVDEQKERLLQMRDSVRDDVHTSWLEMEADRARAKEAIIEASSAREALELTREEFRYGTATSLDVSQAQRDAFNADANLAQSRSALGTALFALRKAAGEPLLEEK
jgi:outer membrane protein TolC